MDQEPIRFLPHDGIEREQLPHGLHDWLSRPDLTGSEHLIAVRVHVEPGNGHPFHRHPTMDEIIYVLAGRAEQWVEEEARVLEAGEAAYLPKDVVHATYNAGAETLVFLAILSPAGDLEGAAMVDVSQEEPWRSLKAPLDA